MKRCAYYYVFVVMMSSNCCGMEKETLSPEIILEWNAETAITALAYSSDCQYIATGHADKVCLWDRVNNTKIREQKYAMPVSSLHYNEREKKFIVFFQQPDELEVVVTEMIGVHAPDGWTSAVGDQKGKIRIYKGPLFYFLKEAQNVELSEEQRRLVQKVAGNKGAPLELTEKEKIIYDACSFFHSFLSEAMNTEERRVTTIKKSGDLPSIDATQQWRLLSLMSKALLYSLSFFKQKCSYPISNS